MKIHRLIAILTLLLNRKFIQASELSEKFGVSLRTIYRDISDLEAAGIPIVSAYGRNGGIGILESYKIDKKLFTSEDIKLLMTSLQSMKNSEIAPNINETIEKIKCLVPNESVNSLEISSKKLLIDISPWTENIIIKENLKIIENALNENNLLEIEYESINKNASKRIVEPHQLILKEKYWYMKAYCRSKNDFRIFKLRRIKKIKNIGEIFSPREFESSVNDFKSWSRERMIEVEMLIDKSMREQALDFCREENISPYDEERLIVKIPFSEGDIGYGYLMAMGHKAVCLRPDFVKKELQRRVKLLYDVYQG